MHAKATTSKGDIGELLVIPMLKAHHAPSGNFVLTEKFLSGMSSYAERWPGKVTALVEVSKTPDSNLDHAEIIPGRYPFEVEALPQDNKSFLERMRQADLILGGPWGVSGVRQVVVAEYGFRTRLQIVSTTAPDSLRRYKRLAVATISMLKGRYALSRLAGVQCNGIPAYKFNKSFNRNALLFFDSRIHASDLISHDELKQRTARLFSRNPLRLTFTGRLIKIKGVDALPRIARELFRLGIRFELNICGSGECEEQITREISQMGLKGQVHMRGMLKYREELLPFIKSHTDLFICPHIQGDPSCTYLETMACGVPIIGYANEAWEGMAAMSKGGWVTPMKNPKLLALRIAELDKDRQALHEAAESAREFAAKNLFEHTMDMRVQHLLSCREQPL